MIADLTLTATVSRAQVLESALEWERRARHAIVDLRACEAERESLQAAPSDGPDMVLLAITTGVVGIALGAYAVYAIEAAQ